MLNYRKIRIAQYFLLSFLSVTLLISCNNCEDDYELIVGTSIYDLNKNIIQVNVTNAATGFQAVFNEMVLDSTSRAHLSQAFANEALFFDDDSGYFFIETLNDAWVVSHINEDLIGTSRIDAEDALGKKHVVEMVNTVNNIGFGFVEYNFENPADGEIEDKLSFVTGITPPGWFIGAGYYDEGIDAYYEVNDANKLLVKEVTQTMANGISGVFENIYTEEQDRIAFSSSFIDHIRFFDDQSGYFFVYDFEGTCIAHGAAQTREGVNYWDLQDAQGNYLIQDILEIVQSNSDGGFYEYYWENPSTGLEEAKVSYVMQIPDTEYWIGAGVYLNN